MEDFSDRLGAPVVILWLQPVEKQLRIDQLTLMKLAIQTYLNAKTGVDNGRIQLYLNDVNQKMLEIRFILFRG